MCHFSRLTNNMIKRFTNYSITKNKFKKDEKQPDYKMSIKDGDTFLEASAIWLKDAKDGSKFFSGMMQKVWRDHTDETKTRDGFVIVSENELNKLEKEVAYLKGETLPIEPALDTSEIPF